VSDRELHLVGLSHKSAPIDVREKVALTGDALKDALVELKACDDVSEAFVISTCNRVEVYTFGRSECRAQEFFTRRSAGAAGHLYEKHGQEAIRHLFTVAASLDSLVVGEQQILGQVKEAYGIASASGAAGSYVSRLCNKAFATAKRVRTETDIGKGMTSASQVAVDLVAKIFGDLKGRMVLLVGAGKMGALSAKALEVLGADRIVVTNRSAERGQDLATGVGGVFHPWEELERLLSEAAVAIVSTGAPHHVVTKDLVKRTLKARRHRSLCLIDLAVPRNVDPACSDLEDVYAYDIDDLDKVISSTRESRRGEAQRAETIVEAEAIAFAKEREARAALPVMITLRRRAAEIAASEVERTLARVGEKLDDRGRESVEAMAQAIVNKLLHLPTARLKEAASSGDSTLPGVVAELFGIKDEPQAKRERSGTGAARAAASEKR
jgi:glutamyl-tRNA reductase